MERRLVLLLLTPLLAGILVACGGNATQSPASSTTTQSASVVPITAPVTVEAMSIATETAMVTAEAITAPSSTEASSIATATAAGTAATLSGNVRTFQIVPDQTEASYEVQEQFLNRSLPNKAIGKTKAVEGQFQFTADGQPTAQITKMTVDLRTLTSDSGRRDQMIRNNWLQSNTYPFAEFTSTEVQNAPTSYTEGQEVTFKLLGNMTIHNTTKPVTFDVQGKLQGDTVTGTATTFLMMRDFGFDPPSVAGILTVQDGVTVTVNFTAKEATKGA